MSSNFWAEYSPGEEEEEEELVVLWFEALMARSSFWWGCFRDMDCGYWWDLNGILGKEVDGVLGILVPVLVRDAIFGLGSWRLRLELRCR